MVAIGRASEWFRENIHTRADDPIGARVYDALHLQCAKKAGCDRIYTFNVRHFRQLAPDWAEQIAAP